MPKLNPRLTFILWELVSKYDGYKDCIWFGEHCSEEQKFSIYQQIVQDYEDKERLFKKHLLRSQDIQEMFINSSSDNPYMCIPRISDQVFKKKILHLLRINDRDGINQIVERAVDMGILTNTCWEVVLKTWPLYGSTVQLMPDHIFKKYINTQIPLRIPEIKDRVKKFLKTTT